MHHSTWDKFLHHFSLVYCWWISQKGDILWNLWVRHFVSKRNRWIDERNWRFSNFKQFHCGFCVLLLFNLMTTVRQNSSYTNGDVSMLGLDGIFVDKRDVLDGNWKMRNSNTVAMYQKRDILTISECFVPRERANPPLHSHTHTLNT